MHHITRNIRATLAVPFAALLLSLTLVAPHTAHAQVCPFDDGNSSLAVEGLILTRYALGLAGAPLVASTGINAVDAPTVESTINCPSCGLNITGNPTLTVADATIISRRLAGFSGAALTDGLALGSGTRNTPAAVASFLLAGCGATGGTVTSITAGTGLTGGVITGSGTIAADTTYLQRRVSATCAAGSFITAVAADGTVTCGTPPAGGTLTSVAMGTGLTGPTITSTGTVALANTFKLPQGCSTGQVPKFNLVSGVWECQTDLTGAGTVTSITASTGLTGGIITGSGTIAADTTFLQRRVSATCAAGSFITAVAADGTVTCGTPPAGNSGTVTSITASTGLTGGIITGSGTIAADTTFLQRRVSATCAAGSFITAVAADGTVTCGIPPAGVTAVAATAPLASSGGTTPNISLTGSVAVANGGTGQSTLAANGVVIGQGTSAVATAVGTAGQVLTGTVGLPTWTGAPTLTGPLTVNGDIKLGSTGQFFASSGEENLRFVRGTVGGGGTPSIVAGAGFSVARTAGFPAGDYTVSFSAPFSNTPGATVSPLAGIAAAATVFSLSANTMRVQIYVGGSLADQNWTFIAVGPR